MQTESQSTRSASDLGDGEHHEQDNTRSRGWYAGWHDSRRRGSFDAWNNGWHDQQRHGRLHGWTQPRDR